MSDVPKRRPLSIRRKLLFSGILVGFFSAGLLGITLSLVDRIPPHSDTVSAMGETYVRLNLAIQRDGQLPRDLQNLPFREGYANRTTDYWGVPLKYTAEDNVTVTFTSLGRDGRPGGVGDDVDLIRRYELVDGKLREMK